MTRSSSRSSAARAMRAIRDCQRFDRHQWHATFQVGTYLCLTCGASFICPVCILGTPKDAQARLCPQHAVEQQERDAQSVARRKHEASLPPQHHQKGVSS